MSELPRGWASAKLGDVIEGFESGRNLMAAGRPATGQEYGVLKVSAVTWGSFKSDENKALPPDKEPRPHEVVRRGDVLISRANTTELVGAVVIVRDNFPRLMLPDKILRIVQTPSTVDSNFLIYALRTPDVRAYFSEEATGTSDSMRNLSQPKIAGAPLILPPLAEQRRIVAKIETLTARSRRAKEALDAIPTLLERFRQSVLAAAFRGDLTADWREKHPDVEPAEELLKRIRAERRRRWEEAELAKMRAKGKMPTDDRWKEKYEEPAPVDASELPELPEGWVWSIVDEIVTNHDHKRVPLRQEERSLRRGDFPYYGAFGVIDHVNAYLFDGNYLLVAEDGKNLLERKRPIALQASGRFWVNNHAHVLQSLGEIPLDYLEGYFNHVDLSDRLTGIDQVKLTAGALHRVAVPLPSLNEQKEISKIMNASLARAATSFAVVTDALSQLVELDRAILAKAFRGELVPQDPSDEPASVLLERLRAEREQNAKTTNGAGRRRTAASPRPAPSDPTVSRRKSPASRRSQAPARSRG
ncbi:restriction endonuclease subunit S [Sorangium sp. So ce124]|uniref:restriction endonuclease subunit S n=1 Tax=Sorangium sp. So ce124 TaxID=3133280 RepID=UPI003F619B37